MLLKKLLPVQKGPATGEALAQLILEGKVDTVDITPFDPARYVSFIIIDIAPSWDPKIDKYLHPLLVSLKCTPD